MSAETADPRPKGLNPCYVGDAKAGEVEVRYDEPEHVTIDEVCAEGAQVHLEMMDKDWCSLMVYTARETACFHISAKKGNRLKVFESWREKAEAFPPVVRAGQDAQNPLLPYVEHKFVCGADTCGFIEESGAPCCGSATAPCHQIGHREYHPFEASESCRCGLDAILASLKEASPSEGPRADCPHLRQNRAYGLVDGVMQDIGFNCEDCQRYVAEGPRKTEGRSVMPSVCHSDGPSSGGNDAGFIGRQAQTAPSGDQQGDEGDGGPLSDVPALRQAQQDQRR